MADAVFSACFLNTCNRNNDIIKMANLAPTVNTRRCIYTYDQGIVLRSTYYVFDLYVNEMGREVINTVQTDIPLYSFRKKDGGTVLLPQSDILTTFSEEKKQICISVVNKAPDQTLEVTLNISDTITCDVFRIFTLDGNSPDSYNDIDRQEVYIKYGEWSDWKSHASLIFPAHSVNIIQIKIV